jgi:hypothetical protein
VEEVRLPSILNNLGQALYRQAKPALAEPLFRRAATIFEMAGASKQVEMAMCLANLRRRAEPEQIQRSRNAVGQGINVSRDERRYSAPVTAEVLNSLDVLWLERGQHPEAASHFARPCGFENRFTGRRARRLRSPWEIWRLPMRRTGIMRMPSLCFRKR